MKRFSRSLAVLLIVFAQGLPGQRATAQTPPPPVPSPASPVAVSSPDLDPPAVPIDRSVPPVVAVSPDYVLRPGDIISVTMAGDPPVTTPDGGLVIPLDGHISFYNVRGLQAAGLTRGELEEALIRGVKKYIRNPSITVNLLATPYTYITVSGAVEKPADYPFRPGLTISEVLTMAGGTNDSADKVAYLHRKDADGKPEVLKIDLMKLYSGGASEDLEVRPGDRVLINDARVYVNGQVKTPGMLTLRMADTVAKAVAASGGVVAGADLRNAYIKRGDQTLPMDLRPIVEGNGGSPDPGTNQSLEPGDILTVPVLQNKVVVIGEASNSTGPIFIAQKSNDKALDVLSTAGATTRASDLAHILLIRNYTNNNTPIKTELNLGPDGPASDNVILQNGDVLYVPTKKVKDRNAAILNATIWTQLLSVLRTF